MEGRSLSACDGRSLTRTQGARIAALFGRPRTPLSGRAACADGSACFSPNPPRCPQRDSNPCYGLERAATWTASRWGPGRPSGYRASRRRRHFEATLLTSPANRLCRQRVDLAVLVDRDHIPLLRKPAHKQVQDEVQPMPAHDHGLSAAPRLDPEALRYPPRDVRIERRRTDIACSRSHLARNRVASVKPARAMTRSRPKSCRFSRRSACVPR